MTTYMVDLAAMKAKAADVDAGPGKWAVYDEEDQTLLSWVAPMDDHRVAAMTGDEAWRLYGGEKILDAGGIDLLAGQPYRSGGLSFADPVRGEMYEEWIAFPKEVGE